MAINSPFFLDAVDLATATSVYLDLSLTLIAPDGFYGDGTITREQSSGILLTAEACATCGTPCGTAISESGGQGIYQVNLDTGTIDTGAIVIRFDPQSVPDGFRATYDGVVYNKLSSPVDGLHESSTPGHFTVVGNTGSDCGLAGNTTNLPSLTEYLYNGTSFVATGNTQSVTLFPGDISLGASPGFCVIVIPKPTGTPNNVFLEMLGPCGGTGWDFEAYCPVALPSFSSSIEYESSFISCYAPLTQTYYFAKVHTAIDNFVGLYDYVFSDVNGEFPLVNGFYLTNNVATPNQVIEVNNGIIVAITSCNPACVDCVPGTEVTIGTQDWTVCNLDVTTYSNGDPIPEVTDAATWNALTTGAWCYYNNDPLNGPKYGKLYNGYAVNDPRGLAPVGYHIPTNAEWTTLTTYLGGTSVAGGAMKETGVCHWNAPNTGATNSSGFTALPGGCRGDFGLFIYLGTNGDWWSSTQDGLGFNYIRYISYLNANSNSGLYVPYYGFSVRLIRD